MLGDYGGADNNTFSSLWEALPSVAVVGGQVRLKFQPIVFFFFYITSFLISKLSVFVTGNGNPKFRKKWCFFAFCVCNFQVNLKFGVVLIFLFLLLKFDLSLESVQL